MEKNRKKLKPWVMASRLILEHDLPANEAEDKVKSLAVTGMKIKFHNGYFGVIGRQRTDSVRRTFSKTTV